MKIARNSLLASLVLALAASCVPEFEFAGDSPADAGSGGSGPLPEAGECATDDDCTNSQRSHCNEFQRCVRCLPAADDCDKLQYCAEDFTCRSGCKNDLECQEDYGPLLTCRPSPDDALERKCLGCVVDGDCSLGNVCDATTECVSGCRDATNCEDGWECCGAQPEAPGSCQLTLVETENCGACGNVCPVPMHARAATCRNGMCGFDCEMYFQDCDGLPENGCEVDTRTDEAHCGGCNAPCGQTCVDGDCAP